MTSSAMASSPGDTSMPSALGGFAVDCEHIPSRLYDRQVARLFTLENAAGVEADQAKRFAA
jgi:hypothetical protein